MEVRDLGTLIGPVLLYGGPYSNLAATEALMALAQSREIGVENRICTGDVVAYGADAEQTWALLSTEGGTVVAGNCEKQLSARADGCGCGFEAGTTCDLLSKGWYDHAQRVLSDAALSWMGRVPDIAVFSHAGRRIAVIHGGLSDISRFLWPSSPDAAFEEELQLLQNAVGTVDMVVAGHCGIAFQRQIGDILWLNAGAIGLPPHDGRPETRFATMDADGRILIERLRYDAQRTIAGMTQHGLMQGYHRTMETGIWPSEDVLPAEMRRHD